jgi:hypothetical protein
MARFVHIDHPVTHAGVVRFSRGFTAVGNLHTTHFIIAALAFIGAPITRAAARVRTGLESLAARRAQRRQDEQLWNIALSDARVMADLSRAMSRDASRDVRGFY